MEVSQVKSLRATNVTQCNSQSEKQLNSFSTSVFNSSGGEEINTVKYLA